MTINATSGNDALAGNSDADSIAGLAGDDSLYGLAGNDTLDGGLGNDYLAGDAGNDALNGGTGNDSLYGGPGNDTYQFATGAGTDTLQDYDSIAGNVDTIQFVDVQSTDVTLLRQSDNLILTYGLGDQLTVSYYFNNANYRIEQFKFSDGVTWDDAAIKRRVIANGTSGNDYLYGYTDGPNRIYGVDGNDTLSGGHGNDLLDGGAGSDTLNGSGGADTLTGGSGDDNLFSGQAYDAVTSTWLPDTQGDSLDGGAGNDSVYAGAGNDTVNGGTGNDSLHGGAGNDTYQFAIGAGTDTIQDYDSTAGNVDTIQFADVRSAEVTLLRQSDNLILTYGISDQLTVSGYFNNANFRIEQFKFSDGVTWDGAAIKSRVVANGTSGNDFLYGYTDGPNRIYGLDGNDILSGGYGNDELDGGAGNDTLNGSGGADILIGDSGDDYLSSGQAYDAATSTLLRDTQGDSFDGGAGNDTLSGGYGNDLLDGGTESDTLTGNGGTDTLIGGSGDDYLSSGQAYDAVTNTGLPDTQGDSLDGGVGNDSLYANSGNDTLDGGVGNDSLYGGDGDDYYILDSRADTVWDSGGIDRALMLANFIKAPVSIETVDYAPGIEPLPYWIDALLWGSSPGSAAAKIAAGDLLFGFPDAPLVRTAGDTGFAPIPTTHRDFIRTFFAQLGQEIGISFRETTDPALMENRSTIIFSGAILPAGVAGDGGDRIRINAGNGALSSTLSGKLYAHEIGHVLGLKHPFGHADASGGVGEGPYLVGSEEDSQWTVMSYSAAAALDYLEYSPLDLASLQYLYGVSPAGHGGNDAYRISGETANFIWDGAGIDTLSASGFTQPVTLYLEPGYWGYVDQKASMISSAGQVTINFGTVIEDLIGGAGSDSLFGNAADNVVTGNAGNDTIDGGSGSDTAFYSAALAQYAFTRGEAPGIYLVSGSDGSDTLTNIEWLRFSDQTASLASLFPNRAPTGEATITGLASQGQTLTASNTLADLDGLGAISYQWKANGSDITGANNATYTLTGAELGKTITVVASYVDGGGTAESVDSGATGAVAPPDLVAPTVLISDNLAGVANASTTSVVYTLTFSEPVLGLDGSDFILTNVAGGTVSGSGTTWTVTLIPKAGVSSGSMGFTLKAGAVTDLAGNPNAAAGNNSQAIDTARPVAPKLVTASSFYSLVDPQVTFHTTLGDVVFELNPTQAPVTVADVLAYVDTGYYNGTLFHRVVPGFVAQGGGFSSGLGFKAPTYDPIVLESNNGLLNVRGTVAMARTSAPDSATSQFFVNLVDNAFLNYSSAANPGYAVFGRVVAGMPVIDSMALVPTSTVGSLANVPQTEIVISSAQQTVAGSSVTNSAVFQVQGLENGGTWEYSLNGGNTWLAGSGNSITVSGGSYAANAIQVRQTDAAGNLSAGAGHYGSALVIDTTAPSVSIFGPADDAANVDVTSNIAFVFSEAVQRGTGSIVLKAADGTVIATYDAATSGNLSISAGTLMIDPSADLGFSTGYGVEFAPGSIKDLAGNNYAGTTSYNFTTAAQTVPGQAIDGGNGVDSLVGSAGNDTVAGGAGIDSYAFTGNRSQYILTATATGYRVQDSTSGRDGTDLLSAVEILAFADSTVDLTMAQRAARISASELKTLEELYVGFFNRVPEAAGLAYWIDQVDSGVSLRQVADQFYAAGIQFGVYSANMTEAQFITAIYANVLGRSGATAPPPEDIAYWQVWLHTGTNSKGAMVLQMLSDSHNFFTGDANVGWVVDLLDNKAEVANYFAVQQGLSYKDPQANIAHGIEIAAAITPTDTSAALALIGVNEFAVS